MQLRGWMEQPLDGNVESSLLLDKAPVQRISFIFIFQTMQQILQDVQHP